LPASWTTKIVEDKTAESDYWAKFEFEYPRKVDPLYKFLTEGLHVIRGRGESFIIKKLT
jgi:hypothetical protein